MTGSQVAGLANCASLFAHSCWLQDSMGADVTVPVPLFRLNMTPAASFLHRTPPCFQPPTAAAISVELGTLSVFSLPWWATAEVSREKRARYLRSDVAFVLCDVR